MAHTGNEKCVQKLCVKNFVVKTTWKRLGCKNDKVYLKGKNSVVAGWINLAEEREKWWVIINMEIKLGFL